jgi:hypothetical protein
MNNTSSSDALLATKKLSNLASHLWAVGLLCTALAFPASAGVSTAPLLLSDDFDTGNTVGSAPAGWRIGGRAGNTVRVVDAKVKEPSSAPYCVELNSPVGRAEMYQNFPSSESGRASASFRMNQPATAHSAMVLRNDKGANLCMVIFAANRVMRYHQAGGGTNSTALWTPNQWQTAQIDWFTDSTFNASLEGTQFVQRAHFITNGIPSRIVFIIGFGTATNKIGYVDDVRVTGAEKH